MTKHTTLTKLDSSGDAKLNNNTLTLTVKVPAIKIKTKTKQENSKKIHKNNQNLNELLPSTLGNRRLS